MKVIEVQDVWKRFSLDKDRPTTLKDLVPRLAQRPSCGVTIWALREVSFDVEQGERIGIMGPNGSGKSTLLRLLAGVMAPSRGRLAVRGRVCPLIELGAGFHGDLSGRDNIFLNGVMLGMSRQEVRERLPGIVEFAGLSRFLDTPLKRYSTGMQLRLGFSVAAHASPDILLVDEVLAVGDEAFQQKCLAKLDEFHRRGGTTIFVSHNRDLVYSFADRVLHFQGGELVAEDKARIADSAGDEPDLAVAPVKEAKPV